MFTSPGQHQFNNVIEIMLMIWGLDYIKCFGSVK